MRSILEDIKVGDRGDCTLCGTFRQGYPHQHSAAGSFGFGEGSRLAAEIESMLKAGVLAEPTRFSGLVRRLRRELSRDPGGTGR